MSTKHNASPQTLDDFQGQPQAVEVLRDMIGSAKVRGTAVPHFMLYGGPGLGKTTLARVIANEMGTKCHVKMAQDFDTPEDILMYITYRMSPGDILILDEVHSIKKSVEESLFHYMETRDVDFSAQLRQLPDGEKNKVLKRDPKRKATSSVHIHGRAPAVTIIGATTNPELLLGPFMDRFQSLVELFPYEDNQLAEITSGICEKNGIKVSQDVALAVAVRSRSTVRVVHNLISSCFDHMVARGMPLVLTHDVLEDTMKKHGIDKYGMKRQDREYLKALANRMAPVGLESLARLLGFRSSKVVEDMIEPYLFAKGWADIGSGGRIITQEGLNILNEVS